MVPTCRDSSKPECRASKYSKYQGTYQSQTCIICEGSEKTLPRIAGGIIPPLANALTLTPPSKVELLPPLSG